MPAIVQLIRRGVSAYYGDPGWKYFVVLPQGWAVHKDLDGGTAWIGPADITPIRFWSVTLLRGSARRLCFGFERLHLCGDEIGISRNISLRVWDEASQDFATHAILRSGTDCGPVQVGPRIDFPGEGPLKDLSADEQNQLAHLLLGG
jgi:hypothetical protein